MQSGLDPRLYKHYPLQYVNTSDLLSFAWSVIYNSKPYCILYVLCWPEDGPVLAETCRLKVNVIDLTPYTHKDSCVLTVIKI
jgi:hypothetical protein